MRMIYVVDASNSAEFADELIWAYRLRHRIFIGERGWHELSRPGLIDIDQFDTEHAIHLLAFNDERTDVVGYSRLLPTTEPHILGDVLSAMVTGDVPRGPTIMEWTRFAVASSKRGGSAIGGIAREFHVGVLEYAFDIGMTSLTMETDPIWITRFAEFGFEVKPLGLPLELHDRSTVALQLELSTKGIETTRKLLEVPRTEQVLKLNEKDWGNRPLLPIPVAL